MRQSRLMAMATASLMMSAMANNATSAMMPSIADIPSPRNRKGELKQDFKHNPRNDIRTKAKRK